MDKEPKISHATIKIILAIAAIISIIALYFLISNNVPKKPSPRQSSSANEHVPIGGDFVLIDQIGNNFSSDQLKGKLSLIYFGFTYCPDICPTSLQKLSKVIKTLDNYHIEVTPVFITVDPERDTASVLKEYLAHFYPKFIGLTGSLEQIKQVADKFKVYYAKTDNSKHHGNYMLDHSSFVYLMDKNGKYLKHFHIDNTATEIIEFIRVNNN